MIWKIVFKFIANIYFYYVMPVVNFFVNITILNYRRLFSPHRKDVENKLNHFFRMRSQIDEKVKDAYLRKIYEWVSDPLGGGLDWQPISLEVMALNNWKDDCDGFAFLAKEMYFDDGEMYSILPYNLIQFVKRAHVIYVRNGKVYSSGCIVNCSLEEYLKDSYRGIDFLLLKYKKGE